MSRFPEYQDAFTFNMFGRNDLPFYVIISRLTKNYPLHYHNFAELSFVIEGSGEEILNGKRHALKCGSASLLLPNHIHEIRMPTGSKLTKYCCMFDIDLLLSNTLDPQFRYKILKIGSELPSHYDVPPEHLDYFTSLVEEMFREYHSKRFGTKTIIQSKLSEAIVFLLRMTQEHEEQDSALNLDKTSAVMEMLKYIHLHYNEELNLPLLSERLERNQKYLSSAFKRYVGKSFVEYLHHLRVGRATSMLLTTNLNISDIALEIGFDNFRTFSRVFKELRGTTPQEFRRHARDNPDTAL
ncbi:AraC family transcriptional regulator [Paenibacillus nasutitermitis]|uniref:AraC family transcriptional regulator n=1 Tax=Paenibacillus nasutitermitis TaxID=1652958 RepID=A0A916ZC58_9BACL|nr:AraC family transcriptional regulator [Paenibacillus nasutitermitis]GGD87313.1 AraC family transcriptional regulator [Paenibacillus nasutitermitis]